MKVRQVKEVMTCHLQTLDLSDDLDLADMIMRLEGIRHLPVVHEGRLVGIISHRDVLRAQVSSLAEVDAETRRELSMRVKVSELLRGPVVTIGPESSLLEAAELMREHRFGSLPVLEGEELIGILTETDLIRVLVGLLKEESNASSG